MGIPSSEIQGKISLSMFRLLYALIKPPANRFAVSRKLNQPLKIDTLNHNAGQGLFAKGKRRESGGNPDR